MSRLFLGTFLVLVLAYARHSSTPGCPGGWPGSSSRRATAFPTVFIGKPGSFAKVREWVANKEPLGIYPVGLLSPEPPPDGPARLPVPWLGTPVGPCRGSLPRRGWSGQVMMLELPATDAEAGQRHQRLPRPAAAGS